MSKQKITKAQKKLKNAVIKKWVPEKLERNIKKALMGTVTSVLGITAGTEILMYGFPFASTGMMGVLGVGVSQLATSYTNKADQKLKTSELSVDIALDRMDAKMSKLFNSYAANENTKEKSILKTEMESVYKDAKALEGFYEIAQGGSKGYGTQSLVFEMVAANTNDNVVTPAVTFNDVANGTVKGPQKNLRDTPSFGI